MKSDVAQRLAEAHYRIEPSIRLIRRLVVGEQAESDPREPIKLLEVNAATTADGIRPVYFGPHAASGITYPSVIVEVTPGEYEEILKNPGLLPDGWMLGGEFLRPAATGDAA